MQESFASVVGNALRAVRRSAGFTLRDVAQRSEGWFRPTSLAGYERGERTVSLERFVRLSILLKVPPERLLADVMREWEERPQVVVTLKSIERVNNAEGRAVADFVHQIQRMRDQANGDSISIRAGDLEVLATASGRRPEEFVRKIGAALG